ncbi:MAG: hypothetical protein AAF921_27670 [Cyanobacteria bacterium P01_D01_bin.44]
MSVTCCTVNQLRNIYWRKLMQAGISPRTAKAIAGAIATYDLEHIRPSKREQQLISYYCTAIAQAKLWRLELLLADAPQRHRSSPVVRE